MNRGLPEESRLSERLSRLVPQEKRAASTVTAAGPKLGVNSHRAPLLLDTLIRRC